MDKKQIRKQFLLEVKEDILDAQERLADNPKFDHLYSFCTQARHKAYGFLYPLALDYQGISAIADLYNSFSYNIDDDGGLVLLHATAIHKCGHFDLVFDHSVTRQIIMYGDVYEIDHASVLKFTLFHSCLDQHIERSLVGFHACRFNWNTLEFLYKKIPDYLFEKAIADTERQDPSFEDNGALKYDEAVKKNELEVLSFIKAQTSYVTWPCSPETPNAKI